MDELELDPRDPHLAGTEFRVARAYRELFAGLQGDEPALRTFPNPERGDELVSVTDIPFHSVCAHHLLPFFGAAHVAYQPGERIVGLSKLARAVEYFARRPQVQERLTAQIADLLHRRLRPAGLIVVVRARHCCMEMRGVNRTGLVTTTSAVRGILSAERRREFLRCCRGRPRASRHGHRAHDPLSLPHHRRWDDGGCGMECVGAGRGRPRVDR